MEDEVEDTAEQSSSSRTDHLKPWQFKPGQSGNPSGKAKGTVSLKEYARKMLYDMDESERMEFLKGIDKKTIWEMSEGKARQDMDIKGEITKKIILADE